MFHASPYLLRPEERLGCCRGDGCGTITELRDPEPHAPVLGLVRLPRVNEMGLTRDVHRGVQRTVAGDLPPTRPVGLILGCTDLHLSPRGDVLQDHTHADVVEPRDRKSVVQGKSDGNWAYHLT